MGLTLFFNCRGHDLPDYAEKSFDSFVVEDGKVTVRDFALETSSRYAYASQVDLEGADVFPAFADAHTHFLQTGLQLSGCNLGDAKTLTEVFDRLAAGQRKNSSEWLLAWNLDETCLKEGRLPTSSELEKVCPGRKLWLSRIDLHSAIPNRTTLTWAEKILPDASTTSGSFRKKTYSQLWNLVKSELPAEFRQQSLSLARDACFAQGVGTIHALEGDEDPHDQDVSAVTDFFAAEQLHAVIYHQTTNIPAVKDRHWPRIGGCLLMDGSFGSRTAALHQAYADDPENLGDLYFDIDKTFGLIRSCFHEHLQLAMHAIGDRAISLLTTAHAMACDHFGKPTVPHRIEHFELPDNRALKMAKEADLLISVQPAFEMLWGGPEGMYAQRLGVDRAAKTNPFKTILHCGLPIAGGSDSPVTPINPLIGIHAFLNHPTPEERIDLNSALAAFILEPHRFAGEAGTRGRLEKGFLADFVCLDQDPFGVPASRLKDIKVKKLFLQGKMVFSLKTG